MTNLIVLPQANLHNDTLFWTLVHDLGVDPECLRVTFFDRPEDRPLPELPAGLHYLPWSAALEMAGDNLGSVTVQSLYPANAAALLELIRATGLDWARTTVIITDNEVDLWKQHFDRHGDLRSGQTLNLDVNVLEVLDRLDRFLCLRHPYGDILETLLGRPLQISDCMLIRRLIADPEEYDLFAGPVRTELLRLQRKAGHANVMLMTKPVAYPQIRPYLLDLLRLALSLRVPRNTVVHLWDRRKPWPLSARLEFQIVMWLIALGSATAAFLGRPRIRFRRLPALTRHEYMMVLLRCHGLIAQHRSGGGAINEALKWQCAVMLPQGTFNDAVRREALGLPVLHRRRNAFSEILQAVTPTSLPDGEATEFAEMSAQMAARFWAFFPTLRRANTQTAQEARAPIVPGPY